jgi:hypothetical protein
VDDVERAERERGGEVGRTPIGSATRSLSDVGTAAPIATTSPTTPRAGRASLEQVGRHVSEGAPR